MRAAILALAAAALLSGCAYIMRPVRILRYGGALERASLEAQAQIGRGDLSGAEASYERALDFHARIYGKRGARSSRRSELLRRKADLFVLQGKMKEARAGYAAAYDAAVGAGEPRALAAAAGALGLFHSGQGDYAAAEPMYLKALEATQRLERGGGAETAERARDLAMLYQAMRRNRESERYHFIALHELEEAYGMRHPTVGNAVNGIGLFFESMGRQRDAEAQFRRAWNIGRAAADQRLAAEALSHLKENLRRQGRAKEAEELRP